MHFVKVTEIMKNRATREIVINTKNIETISDKVLSKIVIGLGGDGSLKESRSVQCYMSSGQTIDLKYNGKANDFAIACMVSGKNPYTNGLSRGISNWTWDEDDTTDVFNDVIEIEETGPVSGMRSHVWQRL